MESRRVKVTKKMIKDAMLELLSKKNINRISIKELCELADINRSTFYSYYDDIYSLLNEIEDELIANIPHKHELFDSRTKNELIDIFNNYFSYIKENAYAFRILLIDSNNITFRNKLFSSIIDKRYEEHYEKQDTKARYKFIYNCNGIISMVIQWIKDDFPITTEEMAKITIVFTMECRRQYNLWM